ncbi:MAG: hypothetical protein IT233_09345 [Bacteroidia bacterium]|nr:hypothetical protein [Bacteroidia bacterium]
MKNNILIACLLAWMAAAAQGPETDPGPTTNTPAGEIEFGVRSTGSVFTLNGNHFGLGAGWQCRYRISRTLNTEWFFDWITTDIAGLGQRVDAHIGESMVIYPGKQIKQAGRFTPYVLGGFCGDYAKITTNLYFDDEQGDYMKKTRDRWSFATQLGMGTHYNFTDRVDISLTGQYVLHFGGDIHTYVGENSYGAEYLAMKEEKGHALEGHFFLTVSANFVVTDLLKRK